MLCIRESVCSHVYQAFVHTCEKLDLRVMCGFVNAWMRVKSEFMLNVWVYVCSRSRRHKYVYVECLYVFVYVRVV